MLLTWRRGGLEPPRPAQMSPIRITINIQDYWLRTVHLAQYGHGGDPVAPFREHRVGIALGPKGAYENGNIGALALRGPQADYTFLVEDRCVRFKHSMLI